MLNFENQVRFSAIAGRPALVARPQVSRSHIEAFVDVLEVERRDVEEERDTLERVAERNWGGNIPSKHVVETALQALNEDLYKLEDQIDTLCLMMNRTSDARVVLFMGGKYISGIEGSSYTLTGNRDYALEFPAAQDKVYHLAATLGATLSLV